MRAGTLRQRLTSALLTAMRNREADAIALTADRAKATAVALAGLPEDSDVELSALEMPTRAAASVLGYHPEHVRRLIRSGRLRARRVGGDYRVLVDDLWPLIEARHEQPGRRRVRRVPPAP
jgi:excisionase family DNA binding protein